MKFFKMLGKLALVAILSFLGGALVFDFAMRHLTGQGDEVVVPAIVGVHRTDAHKMLEDQGLYLIVENTVFDAVSDSGTVISQRPEAEERVKKGRRIHVTISEGVERMLVPEVGGQGVREARIVLNRSGLKAETVISVPHDDVPRDRVIATDPVAGTDVRSGADVHLLVSLGPENSAFLMPNLRGRKEYDVRRHLDLFGIGLARVTYKDLEGAERNVVIGQTPPPGTRIARGTSVEVEVTSP